MERLSSDLSSESLTLTRRQMVTFAGTMALATSAGVNATADALTPVAITAGKRSLRLTIAGKTFELDAGMFGGAARLKVSDTAAGISAALIGATYPGTDIPADYLLRFTSLQGNARVHISSAVMDFDATVPLLAWLEGRKLARSRVQLGGISSALGDGHTLRFRSVAQATLHPDFTLDFTGKSIVTLRGSRLALIGDEAHVWIASSSTPTLLTRKIKRRTFVQIGEMDPNWQVNGVGTPSGNELAFDADCFDCATVEAALTGGGARFTVVTLENSEGSGNAGLRFASGNGSPFSLLPLGNPRFAFVCGDHNRFSLTADVADASSWLHRPGHSLLLGRHPDHPSVEMQGSDGAAEKVDLQTAMLGVAVPMEGVIASPIMLSQDVAKGEVPAKAAPTEPDIQTFAPEVGDAILPIYQSPIFYLDAASVRVTRPEDMLTVKFEFYNLKLLVDLEVPVLVQRSTSDASVLVVELPPQALLEEAYYAESGGSAAISQIISIISLLNKKKPPIRARIAEPTRLAFTLPAEVAQRGIPYTLEGLLTWVGYTNSVVPAARSRGYILRHPQKGTHYSLVRPETTIEAPWGVYLSPSATRESWSHRTQPFTRNGITELWHTTLMGSVYSDTDRSRAYFHPPKVRVVWARGYYRGNEPAPSVPFRNSFTTDDIPDISGLKNRWALVDIMARYQHTPMTVNRLTLTPLGAWLDLKGQWPVTDYWAKGEEIITGVEAWDHRTTMGRDQFVRVVKAGRLFPFGHRASLVTITERKFQDGPDGKRNAYLIQRSFIIIRETEKTYSFSGSRNRQSPFKKVTFKTKVTPDLEQGSSHRVSHKLDGSTTTLHAKSAFWPHRLDTGKEFYFDYVAQDWDGRSVTIRSPLIYIAEEYASKVPPPSPRPDGSPPPAGPPPRQDIINEMTICDRAMCDTQISISGQKIAYSEGLPASADKDRRVLETGLIRMGAENAAASSSWLTAPFGTVAFHARLHRAKVRLEDVEALMNTESGTWIKLWGKYVSGGYGGTNAKGRVFAEISDSGTLSAPPESGALAIDIPPDRSGGFATPNLSVTGLSATEGAFGGDATSFGTGSISAEDFFSNANPKLFGDIRLLDILQGVTLNLTDGDVPNFNDYIVERGGQKFARYDYAWRTTKFGTSDIFKESTSALDPTALELNAFIEKSLSEASAPPQSGVTGSLTNFTLSFEVIEVKFTSFTFAVDTSGNVEVDPVIEDIRFSGALEFINQLRELMNFTSDDGGFAIDISGAGVSAIVTIALPDIAVGIFSLKNMAITAGLRLPFTGDPLRFPFSFCTREKPFEIAVSGFGGGGYFLVELQASDDNAVALIEFSLEFGVCASVSLAGIASGSVEIKGGVMMRFEGDALTFVAFFRMAGRLDILGIIVVAVTFNLTLTYMNKIAAGKPHDVLVGEATLSIDIEILFFSFSVTLTVSKEFEGDDPRFGDWMNEGEWATYCEAFGPATVGV